VLRLVLRLACTCLLGLLLAPVPAALADTRRDILRECQEGRLTGDYTAAEIRDARNNIPDDIDQYSDCRDVLSAALAAKAGGSGGGGEGFGGGFGGSGGTGAGGGGGGELLTPATEEDRRALSDAAARGDDPVEINGREIVPGAAGLTAGAARHDLPLTLLLVLVGLALAALAGLAPAVRRRAPALLDVRRRVLRRA
jgi:hypothetical protein